jgi:hypothetical protein
MYSDLGVLETMGAAFEARKTAWARPVASVDAR